MGEACINNNCINKDSQVIGTWVDGLQCEPECHAVAKQPAELISGWHLADTQDVKPGKYFYSNLNLLNYTLIQGAILSQRKWIVQRLCKATRPEAKNLEIRLRKNQGERKEDSLGKVWLGKW